MQASLTEAASSSSGVAFNPADPDWWLGPEDDRHCELAALRERAAVAWFPMPGSLGVAAEPGYYAVLGHPEIDYASRHPELFSSEPSGTTLIDPEIDFNSLFDMDDPRHARLRRIVARRFSPRYLQGLLDGVKLAAQETVDAAIDAAGTGQCDFIDLIAEPYPVRVICEMMGVPAGRFADVRRWSNVMSAHADPRFNGPDNQALMEAVGGIFQMMYELAPAKERHPDEDLLSLLLAVDSDGERLDTQEVAVFFTALLGAGNETTRNALAHGLVALTRNPDQREQLFDDYEARAATAADEIVRWSTPVHSMRRTVTKPTELGGVTLAEGDRILMVYPSANRDSRVFADPFRFDVTRSPNPHLGFGGPGPHYCLGAQLARRELIVMFRELAGRLPHIEAAVTEPELIRSNFVHAVLTLPCRLGTG